MPYVRFLTCWLCVTTILAAADFAVNSTADKADQAPGDGKCFTGVITAAGAPECTLRAAVQETNALAGADAITLPAGSYNLATSTPCVYRNQGDPNPVSG